jgi:hypothetical protein
MDKLARYREIIRQLIFDYVGHKPANGQIDIIDDKVWIQYDGTSQPVAEALLEAGILREDIVLGFHPDELRQYTGFAVS